MMAGWTSYVLQADGASSPFTRTLSLRRDRHLHLVAVASVEGWGTICPDFSRDFLQSLCLQADITESVLADVAARAFSQSLARQKAQHPPWSFVQYVAAFIDGNSLRYSWIGDMYL